MSRTLACKVRGEWHLFWDPETLAWVLTDSTGASVLEAFLNGSLGEKEISCETREFLEKVKGAGLLRPQEKHGSVCSGGGEAPHGPRHLYFHLTERCNLRCSYCYFFSAPNRGGSSGDIPFALAREALQEAKEMGVTHVIATGGEPLLHPRVFEILDLAKSLGFQVELLTNGTLVTRGLADELSEVCHLVTVSLDSWDPSVHDEHRGRGSHARAMTAVRLLKEAGVPKVAVSAVITRSNQDESFSDFQAFAKNLGADVVSRRVYILQGDERDLRLKPDLRKLASRLERELEEWIATAEHEGTEAKLIWRDHCGSGRGVIAIGADGCVYPCQGLTRPGFACGDLREKTLSEIYEKSMVLRRLRSLTVWKLETCRVCEYRHLCGGGCRALAWNTGRLSNPIPPDYCALNKILAEQTLWRVALSTLGRQISPT